MTGGSERYTTISVTKYIEIFHQSKQVLHERCENCYVSHEKLKNNNNNNNNDDAQPGTCPRKWLA